ncbi:uncharacterized membrane protein YidH (DUF202 family) [Algoriphagus boseongensis]|uniref:Uncharacterized membrane protein YidH (DUF202 family) n=1 Tax=Algoriphagus boseongensis TaxID=1442587 RepID=A0A4R6T5N6_9BACT|nr:DUF202 domain-containing protein [Algoriphagus boseongensis]TDQ16962.1 uncharacterized membrane protein YidH (DUF202 family) [Algoriphagus boseongensis]
MDPLQNPAEKKSTPKLSIKQERNRATFERLQLAWVRTSLSFMVLGIGVYEYYYKRKEANQGAIVQLLNGKIIAVGLFLAALILLGMSFYQHIQTTKSLKSTHPDTRFSLASVLSIFLFCLGMILVIAAIITV